MKRSKRPENQIAFDFDRPALPDAERLPINREKPKVLNLIRQDFSGSSDYLFITGFSSLEFLLSFFKSVAPERNGISRILLGHEDLALKGASPSKGTKLSQEIIDFWLERGFSVLQYGAVIHLIQLIQDGKLEFRILQGLHAKIYLGETHAMLGSSNFSFNGTVRQMEGNVRVAQVKQEVRYEEIKQVAKYYWEEGQQFNDKMLDLLHELLAKVSWREALARAAVLLIEGDWWKSFKRMEVALKGLHIWPTQEQGIGKALYILDNQGSVLVADPTGSGKTRLGTALNWPSNTGFG